MGPEEVQQVIVGSDGALYVPAEFFDHNGVPVAGLRRATRDEEFEHAVEQIRRTFDPDAENEGFQLLLNAMIDRGPDGEAGE